MSKETVIGIDLGTTFSCVGVWKDDHVEIIPNSQGNRTTPSWVAFSNGERLVGDEAKDQYNRNADNTIYDIKRLMGKHFLDEQVQNDLQYLTYQIIADPDGFPVVKVNLEKAHYFKPEEISAMILSRLKKDAEDYLGEPVKKAVITVPAYFNDSQRTATKNAATIAGLNCIRILNEPTAAAMAYGLDKKERSLNVLVFDLGGGTFDVSLVTIDDGFMDVKATCGNTHLGGEDFDLRLVEHLKNKFEENHNEKIGQKQFKKLKTLSEKLKKKLSKINTVKEFIENFKGDIDFNFTLNRAEFEEICRDLFDKCMEPVKNVLKDADLERSMIDEVVLVGGSTRIPKIQENLSEYFGGKTLNKSINPDEAVAYGAAIQAAILGRMDQSGKTDDIVLADVIPLSLGVETRGKIMSTIIPRNSTVPIEKTEMYSTAEDNQKTVLIQVYEGERKFTTDNHLLGTFELNGIPLGLRGVPKIAVTFNVDTDGILNVTAVEQKSQIEQSVSIGKDSGRLSEEQIRQMIDDADEYREHDEYRKNTIDTRVDFEKYLNRTLETFTNAMKDKNIEENEFSFAAQMVLNARKWLNNDTDDDPEMSRTIDEIKDCREKIEQQITPLFNRVFSRKHEGIKEQKLDEQKEQEEVLAVLAQMNGVGEP